MQNPGLASPTVRPLAPPVGAVPFVGLQRQHDVLEEELTEVFRSTLRDGGFILGPEVERFEAEFAAFCGVQHAVGVASGTAALTLAMRAAGIGPGDEVIVPAHTFVASAMAVVHAGAEPVLCDVEAATGLIDVRAAEAAITPRTVAVLCVHLYGQPCDTDALGALCQRHGLLLVEDAAQAHGAAWHGRRAGSLGRVAAFSFYPSKNLGALGDGGAVCTEDEEIARNVRRLRNLGQRRKGEHVRMGYNERLDGLQAAALRVKLPRLEGDNEARIRHAATYRSALPVGLRVLPERPGARCVYHLFPVRTSQRGRVGERLQAAGVACGVHYDAAVHEHEAWVAQRGRRAQRFPEAEAWAREELSLPMFPELRPEEIERVIQACEELGEPGSQLLEEWT